MRTTGTFCAVLLVLAACGWPQEAPIVFDPDVWRTSQDDEVRYDMLGVPVEEIVSIGMTQAEVFVRLGQGVDRGEGKWTWTPGGWHQFPRRTLWITFDEGRVERAKVYSTEHPDYSADTPISQSPFDADEWACKEGDRIRMYGDLDEVVKEGMTKKEVHALLGEAPEGTPNEWIWTEEFMGIACNGSLVLHIAFVDDRVTRYWIEDRLTYE